MKDYIVYISERLQFPPAAAEEYASAYGRIEAETGVHRFTVSMLLMLAFTRHLKGALCCAPPG